MKKLKSIVLLLLLITLSLKMMAYDNSYTDNFSTDPFYNTTVKWTKTYSGAWQYIDEGSDANSVYTSEHLTSVTNDHFYTISGELDNEGFNNWINRTVTIQLRGYGFSTTANPNSYDKLKIGYKDKLGSSHTLKSLHGDHTSYETITINISDGTNVDEFDYRATYDGDKTKGTSFWYITSVTFSGDNPNTQTYAELRASSDASNKKILGYVTASTGISFAWLGVGIEVYYDIDDLMSSTYDGQIIGGCVQNAEWMTVWISATAGAGIGTNPNVGVILVPGTNMNIDPYFFPSAGFSIMTAGASWGINSPVPNVSFGTTLISGSLNTGTLIAFDMKKSELVNIINSTIDVATGNIDADDFVSEMAIFFINNITGIFELPNEWNPSGNIRSPMIGDFLPYFDEFISSGTQSNYNFWEGSSNASYIYNSSGQNMFFDTDDYDEYAAMNYIKQTALNEIVSADYKITKSTNNEAHMYIFARVTPNTDPGYDEAYAGIIALNGGSTWSQNTSGIWKTVNGQWTQLATFIGTYPDINTWHTIKFQVCTLHDEFGTATACLGLYLDDVVVASVNHVDADLEIIGEASVQPAFCQAYVDNYVISFGGGSELNTNKSSIVNNTTNRRKTFPGQYWSGVNITYPEDGRLSNYPNPFSSFTTISYTLPEESHVTLKIYNTTGQLVATLVDEQKPAGQHSVQWNGTDNNGKKVKAGMYFYRIEAGGLSEMKKMIMLE